MGFFCSVVIQGRDNFISMKICIGIPTNRGVKAKTVLSLLEMVTHSKYEFHFVVATEGHTVAENRNYIVVQAKNAQCDYLLFVDDDMVFPLDMLDKLLSHKKEVIGVVSHSRMLPLKRTISAMKYPNELPSTLFRVEGAGTGIMLIDMNVFDKIQKPYFHFTFFDSGLIQFSEDIWFCERVQNAGMSVWCDPTIEIKHIGDYLY